MPFKGTSCATPEQIKYFIETIPQSKTKRLKTIQRYKGSKHGFTRAAFHQKSDNLGNPSVSFFFTKKGISLAGYTTANWSSPEAKYGKFTPDEKAHLFNLSSRHHYICKLPTHAIYCYNDYGPCFG